MGNLTSRNTLPNDISRPCPVSKTCFCPNCGYEMEVPAGEPCNTVRCPKCGTLMMREGEEGSKMLSKAERLLSYFEAKKRKTKKWVQKVKVKWHPRPGIFKEDPKTIAQYFYQNSDSLKQAVARLNFARNRGGWCRKKSPHYNPELCQRIKKAIEIVRDLYAKKEKQAA